MLAYEFKNMNETLKTMYELDDLVFSVLAKSNCKELDAVAIFKTIDGKHPIEHNDNSIFFNTTEEVKIELASTPQFIAFNNKKLITAQATNSTDDRTRYLHTMGDQLGMATKLYQIKGKAAEKETNDDWLNTVAFAVSFGVLFSAIAFCVVKDKRKNSNKLSASDIEEVDNQGLTVNN